MKKLYIILVLFITLLGSGNAFSQSWLNSNFLNGKGIVYQIGSSADMEDGLYVYGYFDQTVEIADIEIATRGGRDYFLAKFNEDEGIKWLKTFGSNLTDYVSGGIVVSPQNNVYVCGAFKGTIYFSPLDSLKSTGGFDSFLACFSSEGDFLWSKAIATGTGDQRPNQIAIDKDQNLLISGFFSGVTFIGAIEFTDPNTANDVFLANYDKNGNFIASKQLRVKTGGSGRIFGINTDTDNYYFTGLFADSLCLDIDTIVSVNKTYDAFIYATDRNLNGLWVRTVFGFGEEYLYSISNFSNSEPFLSGYSNSTQIKFDSTDTSYGTPLTSYGGYDIFMVRYDANGNLLNKKNYGGIANDISYYSTIINDEVHITGTTAGVSYWGKDTLRTRGTIDDALVYAILDGDLNVKSARLLNSTVTNSKERGNSVKQSKGRIYVVGATNADSLVIRDSTYYNMSPGIEKTFLVELGCLPITYNPATQTNLNCFGDAGGIIELSGSGGFTDLMFSIDGGLNYEGKSIFDGLPAGEYAIMAKDSTGCTITGETITLTEPGELLIQSTSYTDVSAYQAEDGTITITADGGTLPYSFTLNEGTSQESGDFTGLVVGEYKVILNDANNCGPLETELITITGPNAVEGLFDGRLKVYPNPATSNFRIEMSGMTKQEVVISLFDASGRQLLSRNVPIVNGMLNEDLDISQLQSGFMFLKIGDEKKLIPVVKR